MSEKIKIALVGNPNSGKTTIFNKLTGLSASVGNWSGVTVEKKEAQFKGHKDLSLIDLPGIYSLSAYSLEELITRDFLSNEKPDLIINILDASNIERNLYLTTQLFDLGIPMILALNMMDMLEQNKAKIDLNLLKQRLGVEIVETSATKQIGLDELVAKTLQYNSQLPKHDIFNPQINLALAKIKELLSGENKGIQSLEYLSVKVFERDPQILAKLDLSANAKKIIEEQIKACEQELGDDAESLIISQRYLFVEKVLSELYQKSEARATLTDKIDSLMTNKYLALPIFAFIMWAVYYISVSTVGAVLTDWTNDVLFGEYVVGYTSSALTFLGADVWVHSLLIDGIIGGVGAVLGFVPQLFILFLFLSILEDSGYMSRVAFILDKLFRRFGLSGKSFIPMLISSGCGVPGIMASRTIENEMERKMTVMLTTFIPCGAKLPIIALIAGAFFPESSLIAPSVYFLGIAMVAISGIILRKTKLFAGESSTFVMELPQYHIPTITTVLKDSWQRVRSFIVKAGTIIFVACGLIWFLSSFNFHLEMVESSESILASIGGAIAPIFTPLGFGNWQATVATITGLVAKENVVGTFGVLLGLGEIAEDDPSLLHNLGTILTFVSAYSFMVFNMLCAPCFAAVGAIRREMGNFKWTFIAIGYQCSLAYIIALIVYQLGSVIYLGTSFNLGTLVAVIFCLAIVYLLVRPNTNHVLASPSLKGV